MPGMSLTDYVDPKFETTKLEVLKGDVELELHNGTIVLLGENDAIQVLYVLAFTTSHPVMYVHLLHLCSSSNYRVFRDRKFGAATRWSPPPPSMLQLLSLAFVMAWPMILLVRYVRYPLEGFIRFRPWSIAPLATCTSISGETIIRRVLSTKRQVVQVRIHFL